MAFLDNSGDIILDAVLTDAGRARLAKGDGSFRIAKFALGDDEIDYTLYNSAHASGSAYYDLEIMQTPVMEAFTNNTSSLRNKLMSLPRTNLLYLPILKLNESEPNSKRVTAVDAAPDNVNIPTSMYMVAVDEATELELTGDLFGSATSLSGKGILFGENPSGSANEIRVDQGLDTTEISPSFKIDSDLNETQYIVRVDNRFASLTNASGALASVSFVDDDNIASYYFSLATDSTYVSDNTDTAATDATAIQGPRGTTLKFKVRASLDLNTSTYLFDQVGTGPSALAASKMAVDGATNYYVFIDSNIRVTGATTGYSLDIPVRFVKKNY